MADEQQAHASLAQMQLALTAALRDPQLAAPEGLAPAALQVYRRLVYNNVERALARAFPVLRAISGDAEWHTRVRSFFAAHRCTHPELRRLPEDFIAWLDGRADTDHGDPEWIAELCHYEWVELALATDAQEIADTPAAPFTLARPLQLSPLAWVLSYRYAVHRIGPDQRPQGAPANPTQLIVYRDRGDQVRFMEIDGLTFLLLRGAETQGTTSAGDLLQTLAAELGRADSAADLQPFVVAGSELLKGLLRRDILLGSKPA